MSDFGTIPLPDGCCLVDGPTAYEVAQAIRIALSAIRANSGSVPPRLVAAGRHLGASGERWAAGARQTFREEKVGTTDDDDHAMVDLVETIGSKQAARIMRVTSRAVTGRAKRGTLPGRQLESGEWLFPLTAVVDAAQARKDRHAV
ncbi:MAG: hypothetical protein M3450_06200 [Actinomycetota bacterium]|nr:hypothetical protein [Actinomycetota bacterium]